MRHTSEKKLFSDTEGKDLGQVGGGEERNCSLMMGKGGKKSYKRGSHDFLW